jgi:hypothetical protein
VKSVITEPDRVVVSVEIGLRVIGIRLFKGEERTGWLEEDKELRVNLDDASSIARIEEALEKAYPGFKFSWMEIGPNGSAFFRGVRKEGE